MMEKDPEESSDDEYRPDWAHRAEHIDHKPEWVDAIPHELWELGSVFFPIPNLQKAWKYPHHLDTHRYEADDEILNAYLESNANYGIACAGDLSVVDIDEREYIDYIKQELPDTVWQVTGSRTGEHFFFMAPGLNTRIILRVPHPQDHMSAEGIDRISGEKSRHIGEVKCDPHGYVVGPGSKHPSGNKYGPLEGEEIAEVTESELRSGLDVFINQTGRAESVVEIERRKAKDNNNSEYKFYNLSTDDVVPWLEGGKRVPHPVHGSSTGSNFMKADDEDVFMCWRHDYGGGQGCALNPQHLLAVMATNRDCDHVRRHWHSDPRLHYKAWLEAVDRGLVSHTKIPYTVAKGYAVQMDYLGKDEELVGELYWDTINAVRIGVEEYWLRDQVEDRKPE